MAVNIFSFVLMGVILYIIYSEKYLKKIYIKSLTLLVLIEMYIECGNFIDLGEFQVSYASLVEVYFCLLSLLIIVYSKCGISRTLMSTILLLVFIMILGILFIYIFPSSHKSGNSIVTWDMAINGASLQNISYNPYMIKQMIQMIMFIIDVVAMSIVFTDKTFINIFTKFCSYTKCIVVIGYLEFFIKYVLKSNAFNAFTQMFFGKTTQAYVSLLARGNGYMLQGFTKESSHYAYVLLISLIALTALNTITKKEVKWILAVLFLMIFAMSFSSYYFIACYILFLLFVKSLNGCTGKNIMKVICLIIVIICLSMILITQVDRIHDSLSTTGFIGRRIVSVIDTINLIINSNWLNNMNYLELSTRVRLGSIYETLKLSLYRPIFGYGICAVTSHGSSTMILCGIGYIGSYLWFKMMIVKSKFIRIMDINGTLLIGVMYFIINLTNSLWLRPFYEMSAIICLYSMTILYNYKNRKDIICD